MKADPKKITQRLRDTAKQQDRQVKDMREVLTISDAIIDEYDEVIDALDTKNVPLVNEINSTITTVCGAYDARIAAGCLSPLIWQEQESTTIFSKAYGGSVDTTTWKVVKDPSQRVQLNYYGCKYYRHPKNREYGANVIDEISDASVDQLTDVLVIFDSNANDYTAGTNPIIKIGDYITDDLEEPYTWTTGNIPTVVGLGTTGYPKEQGTVSGFCTSGVNRIYGDNITGFLTSFSIGDYIYDDANFPQGTYITGFGTAVAEIIIDGGVPSETDIDYVTTSEVAIGTTEYHEFTVGIVSTYNAVFLDTITTVGAARSSFLIVRGPTNADLNFEVTKNPIDPVEIGLAEGNKIGKGHRISLMNNGDPKVIAKWHEVRNDPEPAVGAGYCEYWVGASSWPTIQTVNRSGAGTTASPYTYSYATAQYVPEGYTISVSSGSSIPSAIRSTTSVSPTNPGLTGCTDLTTAISTAESAMSAKISENTPKINHNLKASQTLRRLRDEEETTAWSMLQGIAYIADSKTKLNNDANEIDDFNWRDIQ
jgi:hypothetical protein